MEKKNWINPQIKGMDVVKTHSEECTCEVVPGVSTFANGSTTNGNGGGNGNGNNPQNHHFCHAKKGNPQHSSEDNGAHFHSVGCTEIHIINGQVVGCCCYRAGTSGN